jgi:hypothetical protein
MTRYLSICMPASSSQTRVGGGVDHYHLIFLLDIRLNRQGMMTLNQTVGSVIKRGGARPGAVQPRCPWSYLLFAAAKRQDAQLQQSEVFDSRPGRRRRFLEPLTTLRKQTRPKHAIHQAKDSFFLRRNCEYEYTVGKVKHSPATVDLKLRIPLTSLCSAEEATDSWLIPPSMKL